MSLGNFFPRKVKFSNLETFLIPLAKILSHCVGGDIVKNVSLFSDWLPHSPYLIGDKRHLLVKLSTWNACFAG